MNDEQKLNHLFYTLEYKSSRRNIIFEDFTLLELPKDEQTLIYKPGQKSINVGIEVQVEYMDDKEKRNANNALKIYSD